MSEKAEEQNHDDGENQAPESVPYQDFEELKSRLEQAEGTKERLLRESRENKNKYQQLKHEKETREKEEAEGNQQWEKVVELTKADNSKLAQENESLKKQSLLKSLHFEVARHATDAHDVGDVIKAINDYNDLVQIDEESLTVQGVKDAVDKIRDEKSYLFKSAKVPGHLDSRPGKQKPKTYGELTKNEKSDLLRKGFENLFNSR